MSPRCRDEEVVDDPEAPGGGRRRRRHRTRAARDDSFRLPVVVAGPEEGRADAYEKDAASPADKDASAPAQKEAAAPAELPAGYAGAETCKGCHEESWQKFSRTKMGRLFLYQARNTKEALGLRELPRTRPCPRRGGRRQGCGRHDHLRQERPHADRAAKPDVPVVPHQGRRGCSGRGARHDTRDVACTSCHRVMEDHSLAASSRSRQRSRRAGRAISRSAPRSCARRTCRCARAR